MLKLSGFVLSSVRLIGHIFGGSNSAFYICASIHNRDQPLKGRLRVDLVQG